MSDDFEHQAEVKAGTVGDWIKAHPILFWVAAAALVIIFIAAVL